MRKAMKIPGARSWFRSRYQCNNPALRRKIMGIDFPNPVGMAAGFDKDGKYIDLLPFLGFGFAEIGTVTPLPQLGNPKPRSEEHTSELQSRGHLVCRLLLEKKNSRD